MSGLSEFKQSFKGDIVTPDDDGYNQAIARWAANSERNARVVAFVNDTDDVGLALKYARTNNLQVTIRGGGHSICGASYAEEGLVVDLSRYFDYAVVDLLLHRDFFDMISKLLVYAWTHCSRTLQPCI